MERLTKRSPDTTKENGVCCTHFHSPECFMVEGNCSAGCKWEEAAWSRLADYEDTRMTPGEVRSLWGEWNAMMRVLNSIGSYDRLRELAEADKDGRLVVLPVKPVFTPILLYIIEDGDIYEDALYEAVVGMSGNGEMNVVYTTLSDQIIFEQADIGKTVFFTREEAKKALEGKRNA